MRLPAGAVQKASQWLTTSAVMHACIPSRPHSSSRFLQHGNGVDRKFLAVAVVADAVVVNATDSDWSQALDLLRELEVEVEELCPHLP